MRILILFLFSLSLYAENIICLNAVDDIVEAIEVNDKDKALELTDVIIKVCKDMEVVELAKKMKWELKNERANNK